MSYRTFLECDGIHPEGPVRTESKSSPRMARAFAEHAGWRIDVNEDTSEDHFCPDCVKIIERAADWHDLATHTQVAESHRIVQEADRVIE